MNGRLLEKKRDHFTGVDNITLLSKGNIAQVTVD